MSWNALANNQTVSYSNLADAVTNGDFVDFATIPTTGPTADRQMTRTAVESYVEVDQVLLDANGVLPDQLVVKSDLKGYVNLSVSSASSLDICINTVEINGNPVPGLTLPVCDGESTSVDVYGIFGTVDITVIWTSSISGQNVTVTGSDNVSECYNSNGGDSHLFTGIVFSGDGGVSISASDGACS